MFTTPALAPTAPRRRLCQGFAFAFDFFACGSVATSCSALRLKARDKAESKLGDPSLGVRTWSKLGDPSLEVEAW